MRILLDGRPLQTSPDTERSQIIRSAMIALAAEGVEWVSVVDHRYKPGLMPGLPGSVVTRRALPGSAGWKVWYDRTIPKLARREAVGMIWLTAGIAAADCGVAQSIWMPERADPTTKLAEGRYPAIYRGRLKASLERAATVFCFSGRDAEMLTGYDPTCREKIRVLRAAPDEDVRPLSQPEKTAVRLDKTGGKEFYFADCGGAGEAGVVEVLKAFSLFKKRQLSGMKLVLGGRLNSPVGGLSVGGLSVSNIADIREKLQSYKYRDDVYWAEESRTGQRALAGAAYAALFPFDDGGLGSNLLNAWRAGVPAIVADGAFLQEIAGEAVARMLPGDPASLAAELMRIYKEEDPRAELIARGFEKLNAYTGELALRAIREGMGAVAARSPGAGT